MFATAQANAMPGESEAGQSPELLWDHAAALGGLGSPGAWLVFDYDGTLAPLVAVRGAAAMQQSTALLFAGLCSRFRCAVLSGRARVDVAARMGAARPAVIIGNHGAEDDDLLEWSRPAGLLHGEALDNSAATSGSGFNANETLVLIRQLLDRLSENASSLGISEGDIENKRFSLSVHFPRAATVGSHGDIVPEVLAQKKRAVEDILRPFLPHITVMTGRHVLNIVSTNAPNKGDALRKLARLASAAPILFVGDDVTDEDGFRVGPPLVTGVRIGFLAQSAASYYVEGQPEIDRLLEALLKIGT